MLSCLLLFSLAAMSVKAQRAQPIRVLPFYSRIPVLASSDASYGASTRESNADGIITVKDPGPAFDSLQQGLQNYLMLATNASMAAANGSYGNAAPPSQEQVNQMMQKAMQMQSMSPEQIRQMSQGAGRSSAPAPAMNAAAMQEMGKATDAAATLNKLSGELVNKALVLLAELKHKQDALPALKVDCEEHKVQGADLALPGCGCVKAAYLAYYQKQVTLQDQYLPRVEALIQSYLPKFKEQVALIDQVESDLKYGDALSMPVLKNQLMSAQQQAVNALTPILGIISQRLQESAEAYANVVNTRNGHVSTPCQ